MLEISRCCYCVKEILIRIRMLEISGLSLLHPSFQRYLKRSWLGCRVIFREKQSASSFSVFVSYGDLKKCDFSSHCLTTYRFLWTGAWRKGLLKLDFSAAFDRVSHRGLLHKLWSIAVERQLLSIVSEFLSDRRQSGRLDGNVSASDHVDCEVPLGSF